MHSNPCADPDTANVRPPICRHLGRCGPVNIMKKRLDASLWIEIRLE